MAKLRINKKIVGKNKKTKSKFTRTNRKGDGDTKRRPQGKSKKIKTKKEVGKKEPQASNKKSDFTRKRKADDNGGENEAVESKKPKLEQDLTRKAKEKKKLAQRKERKVSTESLEKIKTAKEIWEHLRRHDLKKNERDKMVEKIMSLVKPHIHELSLKHDTARIIQCVLKFGSNSTRNEVFDKLNDHILELSKVKYAKFVVKALFRYCTPDQRSKLITKFYNHVPALVRHKEAVELVELAYNDYANVKERSLLLQEFYGSKFALFKDNSGQSLAEILSAHPEQKDQLITFMKKALMPLLDKNLVKHNIVHSALLEFMLHCDEASRAEMIDSLKEVAVGMLHTREGAKVNLQCIWHGSAKDRKVYVKSLKGLVANICKEEHGHLVLLGIFDCVDDTVLVTKHVINEMVSSLEELCQDKHARRVILYLMSPRSPQHFSNQFLQLLTPGDSNTNSKKPQGTRWEELRSAISPSLIKLLTDKVIEWICQKPLAPLLIQGVESCSGDVTPILSSLCESLSLPFEDESNHIVGDPCGHWVLKRLIAIKRDNDIPSFADMILESVSVESLQSWSTTNRGSFVLVSLISSSESNKGKVVGILSPLIDKLRTSDREGVKVLLKTIEE